MNLLCRIGLHRWDFQSVLEGDPPVEITYAMCRRRCPTYAEPRFVNGPLTAPSRDGSTFPGSKPSTSAGEAAPTGSRTIGEESCTEPC